jgi:hypothetical protein
MILCDAGPLVALLDNGQPEPHKQCLKLTCVFTLDHHFYAYRTLDGNALDVVP